MLGDISEYPLTVRDVQEAFDKAFQLQYNGPTKATASEVKLLHFPNFG